MNTNIDNNTYTITRKYELIPTYSNSNNWNKKVIDFTLKNLAEKIELYKKNKKKEKDKDEKLKWDNKIKSTQEALEKLNQDGELTQKMVNDYTYNLVRVAMYEEAQKKNYIVSYIVSQLQLKQSENITGKEFNDFMKDAFNYCYRKKGSSKGSLLDGLDIEDILGGYGTAFKQMLTSKIKDSIKQGLLYGKVNAPRYKTDSPFTIRKDCIGFNHNCNSLNDLSKKIGTSECKLYLGYGINGSPSIANFIINVGHKKNREELLYTLFKIYSKEYEYCGSSMQISKNKIILNLSIKVPKTERKLDENTVVGVDLGIAIPAMCALNNNMYKRLAIGSADDFLRVRTKLQNQRKRLQKALKNTSGGHGRKKKLQALERMKKSEAHFVETYCHMVSKKIVDFALKNNAKYINIENLNGYDSSEFILRNWSFYKLQQYITYKAEKYGIVVRKINPCYTSQICSVCGNWELDQRKTQAKFECADKECDSHKKYKYGFNADFNAARNIAKSTLWMEKGEVTEKKKEEARKYYGFDEKYKQYKEEEENKKEKVV